MLATVALGYADGMPRTLSNKGVAAIAGVRVPIVGRVSMDMITLDVTDLAAPPAHRRRGGIAGRHHDPGRSGGQLAGTNEYEILTRLRRVPQGRYESAA